jgi:hypothetical protein
VYWHGQLNSALPGVQVCYNIFDKLKLNMYRSNLGPAFEGWLHHSLSVASIIKAQQGAYTMFHVKHLTEVHTSYNFMGVSICVLTLWLQVHVHVYPKLTSGH